MSPITQLRCQLAGWTLFVLSALGFVAASLRAGDGLALAGSLLFLVACFAFIAALAADYAALVSSSSPPRKYSRYRPGRYRAARCLSRAPVAPTTPPAPARLPEQSRRLAARQELRFYASTR